MQSVKAQLSYTEGTSYDELYGRHNVDMYQRALTSSTMPSTHIPQSAWHVEAVPAWSTRPRHHVPYIVRINKMFRAILVTLCGLVLLGYGLDVAASYDLSKLQERARRLAEQNTELSAQLLKAISFQGIQANVVGWAGLRVPEHVLIVKEIKAPPLKPYKSLKYYLPLMAGY